MEKSTFNLKNEYQKFVSGLKKYNERTSGYNGPEEMVFQFNKRCEILDNLSDLCNTFTDNSRCVLESFDKYKEHMRKSGINIDFSFFTDLTNRFVKLVSERDEIYKWMDQLLDEAKYLEENKVTEMSIEDIDNL